jgi:hypothetical protein
VFRLFDVTQFHHFRFVHSEGPPCKPFAPVNCTSGLNGRNAEVLEFPENP